MARKKIIAGNWTRWPGNYEEIDWNSAAGGGRIRKRKCMYVVKKNVIMRRDMNAI